MPPRKHRKAAPISAIDRAAKRAEQKAAGAFDGRFRPRVVKNKKRYSRKRKDTAEE
jgi:hypothetical protein